MSLIVSHLTKVYGQQKAVNDVSFSANKGEILGFLGPNGAGKSTTMKISTCYIPPTEGTVQVCGYDVVNSPVEVRQKVGYLPEHNPLYLDMYVHEYLQFIGSLHGLKGAQLAGQAKQMIELVGLTREQNKKIGALSKGYRQRVGLAQALIHQPEVLILDEPTTGLDPNQILEIRQVIKQIAQERTVVFSTHIMQEVQALCDRVVIIRLGEIVADQALEQLSKAEQLIPVRVTLLENVTLDFWKDLQAEVQIDVLAGNQFLLTPKNASQDIRKDIFHYVVVKNAVLIGMEQQIVSLEQVFKKLTQ